MAPLPPAQHPRTELRASKPTKPAPEDCHPVDIEALNAWYAELAKNTPKGNTITVTYEPVRAGVRRATARPRKAQPWDGNPLPGTGEDDQP